MNLVYRYSDILPHKHNTTFHGWIGAVPGERRLAATLDRAFCAVQICSVFTLFYTDKGFNARFLVLTFFFFQLVLGKAVAFKLCPMAFLVGL